MQSTKAQEKHHGREKLTRIIDTCRSVEEHSLDPFLVDIDESIKVTKEYLPEWRVPEDLCLDAETIHHIASVIKLQSEWVKHRSTSLYTDPFLLHEKIMRLGKEEIAEAFLKAWHPIVEMEQISLHSIVEALRYWKDLLPLDERWKEVPPTEVEMGVATREELVKQRILREQAFGDELERYWQQLKTRARDNGSNGKLRYWDFISAKTYEETVERAFMTSFLITYGYATMEIHPLEEEMFIEPKETPDVKTGGTQLVSLPIAITAEEWKKWNRGEPK